MASNNELTRLSATAMATKIASGEISSLELVNAHIERIEQVNPALNAMVFKTHDRARTEAMAADAARLRKQSSGIFHGVPITIKECLDVAGTPSTFGLKWRADIHAEHDDIYVGEMRKAGAVILGKTNVAQCLLYYESDNPLYGRSNNPWNLERTCGGSSGGEAAIIAAGGSPLGLGTDIGGSCRVPAAFCGVVGFKPTDGRVPDTGLYSLPIGQRAVVSQVGVLARHVEDVANALSTINQSNFEPGLALPDYRQTDIAKLRIAVYHDDRSFAVAPAVARAVKQAAALLRANGAELIEWQPPDVPEAVHLYFALLSADRGVGFKQALRGERADPRLKTMMQLSSMPAATRFLARGLLRATGQKTLSDFLGHFGYSRVSDHWQWVEAQMQYRKKIAAQLEQNKIDAILCPPCALPALTHGASQDLGVMGAYGMLWNLLGYPAGVVPVTRVKTEEESTRNPSRDIVEKAAGKVEKGSAGLPIGVQVVARPWREHIALAVMNAVEQAARKGSDYPEQPPL